MTLLLIHFSIFLILEGTLGSFEIILKFFFAILPIISSLLPYVIAVSMVSILFWPAKFRIFFACSSLVFPSLFEIP